MSVFVPAFNAAIRRVPGVITCASTSRRILCPNNRTSDVRRAFSESPARTASSSDDIELPSLPTDCCMSGCANCVWVVYAEELARIYKDRGEAADKVLEAIEDPSLKIFISLELRERFTGPNQ